MFVKTATGHIFGAFNSLNFRNVSKYELSYEIELEINTFKINSLG